MVERVTRKHLRALVAGSLILAALLLSGCAGLGGEPRIIATRPAESSGGSGGDQAIAARMQLGGELWGANCAECHGPLGEGTRTGAPLPSLTDYSDAQILTSVTNGIPDKMPAFGEQLSAEQLDAVANYAKMISLARERGMIDNAGESAAAVPEPGTTEEPAVSPDLPTTSDPSVIQIQRVASQLEVVDNVLYVLQIVQFVNTSESLFQINDAEGHTSVSVRIPESAQLTELVDSGYRVSSDGTQIIDIAPVMPGEAHIMHVAYSLPYNADGVTVAQAFDFALAGPAEVLVVSDGLTLESEALQAMDSRSSNGITVRRYGNELTLPANSSVQYRISGVPQAPARPATTAPTATADSGAAQPSPLGFMLIGAGASALLIAGGLFLKERLAGSVKAAPAASSEQLVAEIAALDALHRDGKVAASEYHRKRAELKARLSKLMKSPPK